MRAPDRRGAHRDRRNAVSPSKHAATRGQGDLCRRSYAATDAQGIEMRGSFLPGRKVHVGAKLDDQLGRTSALEPVVDTEQP